jgi:2-polyprenyl-3-methyl-5-hydroxy-6-metoxy-1,4-benzoquinol methylase
MVHEPMKHRNLQAELMDDPDIDPDVHRAALRGLSRVNSISDAATPIAREIREQLLEIGGEPPTRLSVLDVATGSGDLPVKLAAQLGSEQLDLEMHACDISPTALDATADRSRGSGVPITTHAIDVLADPIPEADVITCALFMHHLTEEDAIKVLASMARSARKLLVVSDLCRTRAGLVMAAVATQLFTRSRVVHVDAVRSVQGAFTIPEMRALAGRAELDGAQVKPIRPARMLLSWKPGEHV